MPVTLHAPLLLLGVFWVAFSVKFVRSYQAGKLNTGYARSLWFSYFLGGLVITFSGKEVEVSFDRLVGEIPIALYIKFVCALLIIHTLYFALRPVMRLQPWKDRVLRYGCLVTLMIGLLAFPLFVGASPASKEHLRYALIALRDGVIGGYMVVAFIPSTYQIWRREQVVPMKVKHFAGLMFDMSYLLLALGNLLTFMASVKDFQTAAFVDQAFRPVMSLCILFFMVKGAPNRLLAITFWPQRWWVLYRLRRLEARIASLTNAPLRHRTQTNLEGHIYRTVIFVLDRYGALREQPNPVLYLTISSVIMTHLDYSQLVEHLAKVA